MTVHLTKEVDPGTFFPSLKDKPVDPDAEGFEPLDNPDDAALFSQITAPFDEE